jgi:quercetin dioxygenase-like cupin family protein
MPMPPTAIDQPVDLASLVQHQPDTVVSRILAKNAGGSVTLFAFDGGQELSEHSAPFDALVHVVHGHLDVRVGDHTHEVAAGEVLRLPAEVPHAVHAPVSSKMLLVMLKEPKADS